MLITIAEGATTITDFIALVGQMVTMIVDSATTLFGLFSVYPMNVFLVFGVLFFIIGLVLKLKHVI